MKISVEEVAPLMIVLESEKYSDVTVLNPIGVGKLLRVSSRSKDWDSGKIRIVLKEETESSEAISPDTIQT